MLGTARTKRVVSLRPAPASAKPALGALCVVGRHASTLPDASAEARHPLPPQLLHNYPATAGRACEGLWWAGHDLEEVVEVEKGFAQGARLL